MPELCEKSLRASPKPPKEVECQKAMEHIFTEKQTTQMNFTPLCEAVMKERNVKKRAAVKFINDCVMFGILEKSGKERDTRYKCLFLQSKT